MISSDDFKDEIKNHQESLAKLAKGQDIEKNNKTTGTPYLMSPPTGKENEKTIGNVDKPKTRTKRQPVHKRPLTKREAEVVRLISGGLRNKDVAKALGISVKTVETHRVNIMNKLSLQNLAQLIRYAVQNGLIHIELENQ
ncbi:MAG: response regulator transcription factor [Candidatus Manganitrophus sp.]|nr:response regulator transcription factor [Candidatus Manganitrophus sp.]